MLSLLFVHCAVRYMHINTVFAKYREGEGSYLIRAT